MPPSPPANALSFRPTVASFFRQTAGESQYSPARKSASRSPLICGESVFLEYRRWVRRLEGSGRGTTEVLHQLRPTTAARGASLPELWQACARDGLRAHTRSGRCSLAPAPGTNR